MPTHVQSFLESIILRREHINSMSSYLSLPQPLLVTTTTYNINQRFLPTPLYYPHHLMSFLMPGDKFPSGCQSRAIVAIGQNIQSSNAYGEVPKWSDGRKEKPPSITKKTRYSI